jgi:NAD(P)-dependent dehydrogenase (short-subunit alcohol dehydrogenase family)
MDVQAPTDPSDIFSAKDLVVVITGGGSGTFSIKSPYQNSFSNANDFAGIGLAFAAALQKTSAKKVYILGRRSETLNRAAESLDQSKSTVVPIVCDVTNPFTLKTAVEQIEKEVGYIDVLINNAGISGPDHTGLYGAKSIEELQEIMLSDWPGWASTFAINTAAVVGVSASFLSLLDKGNQRRGWASGKLQAGGEPRQRKTGENVDEKDLRTSQIISVSSIASFNRVVTAGLAYNSSKAGATALGKTLATLLGPWGIRSNVIAPGSKLVLILHFVFELP